MEDGVSQQVQRELNILQQLAYNTIPKQGQESQRVHQEQATLLAGRLPHLPKHSC